MVLSSHKPKRHSTKQGAQSFWDSKRVALCALFCAAALLLSFIEIPLIPAAPFLKYDPSGPVALVAGLAFGPGTGVVVAFLPWLAHVFIEPVGAFISMVTMVSVTFLTSCLYAMRKTRAQAAVALLIGGVAQIAIALLLNLWLTPLYTGVPFDAVVMMIVPFLLPFNVIKALANALITFFIYKPLSRAIGP